MIKRILVALDLDLDTPIAIRHAIALAEAFDASLTGLAVVDTKNINRKVGVGGIGSIYYADMVRTQLKEKSRVEAGALLETFNEIVDNSGVRHASAIDEGVPYQRIIEEMKYHDLLVIGRESHFFYYNPQKDTKTLAQIVKQSTVPVLMVTESYLSVQHVVIAYDGSTASARTIQWFVQLQPFGRDIKVDLIHICDTTDGSKSDKGKLVLHLAADFLKAHGYINVTQQLLIKKDINGIIINDFVRRVGGDVVLIGAHSMSAMKRLTFGSTTHELVKNSPVPLFISH